MRKQVSEIIALSTNSGSNRFDIFLYVQITREGLLVPLNKRFRKQAHKKIKLTLEYLSYEEELQQKQESTRYNKEDHAHWVDMDFLNELRIRRCLVAWDLDEKIPELKVGKLTRIRNQLEDKSLEEWKRLPPLMRKAISDIIYQNIGMP